MVSLDVHVHVHFTCTNIHVYTCTYTVYCTLQEEVHANIGKGIATLGPTMTLDTVVEVLLISIGTISGQ